MKRLLLFFLVISVHAFAVEEYYSITRSIRSLGMGGAFYGLSNDEYALFYNPAGLSLYTGESQGMLRINAQMSPNMISALKTLTKSGNQKIGNVVDSLLSYQGQPIYGQFGLLPFYLRKHFAVGLLIADTKMNFDILGKGIDSSVDVSAISDSGLVVGYARPLFLPELHVGLNAKLLYRAGGREYFSALDIATNQSFNLSPKNIGGAGAGVDFDLGATYELQGIPWGLLNRASLVFNNLVGSTFPIGRQGGNPPALTRMFTLAYYTVLPGWNFIDNFHLLLDLAEFNLGGEASADYGQRVGSFFKHVNWGVEMPIRWFSLRAGFHQGYITAGFGVNLKYARLDFATYGEELAEGPGRLQSRR